ncbi:MAG: tRNA (guanosine(46)-N7)-methyltransferase TrmB, partial [Gammaproteobacteria bacterium]
MSEAHDDRARSGATAVVEGRQRRTIRSFVRREGRITPAQRRGLASGWPRFGLASDDPIDFDRAFGRRAERVLEIGFGMGDALLHMARHDPARDYIGLEVYNPGLGRVLGELMTEGLTNVRLLRGDAVELLPRCIAPASLALV